MFYNSRSVSMTFHEHKTGYEPQMKHSQNMYFLLANIRETHYSTLLRWLYSLFGPNPILHMQLNINSNKVKINFRKCKYPGRILIRFYKLFICVRMLRKG
jgi:hypothetical protein